MCKYSHNVLTLEHGFRTFINHYHATCGISGVRASGHCRCFTTKQASNVILGQLVATYLIPQMFPELLLRKGSY